MVMHYLHGDARYLLFYIMPVLLFLLLLGVYIVVIPFSGSLASSVFPAAVAIVVSQELLIFITILPLSPLSLIVRQLQSFLLLELQSSR